LSAIITQVKDLLICTSARIGNIFARIQCKISKSLQVFYLGVVACMHVSCKIISYTTIGVIYFSIANLDPVFRSQLGAINLVSVFNNKQIETYGFDVFINPFICDLEELCKVNTIISQ